MHAEFQLDRHDYLDTIRGQDRTIKLYEQLLATVIPCLRRDCNYFNIDKVKVECTWNDDSNQWELPKLTINKTTLSPAPLPKGAGFLDRRGKGTTPVHITNKPNSSSSDINVRDSSNSLLRGGTFPSSSENLDEGKYMFHHMQQKSDESVEYFKPKRALELIGQSSHSPHMTKESFSPLHNHVMDTPPSSVKGSGSLSSLPNAAAVHGIDPLLDSSYGRRPGKLQSLARNPHVPHNLPTRQEPTDILEKVERKMASRKNLEPLADIKTKRPSY